VANAEENQSEIDSPENVLMNKIHKRFAEQSNAYFYTIHTSRIYSSYYSLKQGAVFFILYFLP